MRGGFLKKKILVGFWRKDWVQVGGGQVEEKWLKQRYRGENILSIS